MFDVWCLMFDVWCVTWCFLSRDVVCSTFKVQDLRSQATNHHNVQGSPSQWSCCRFYCFLAPEYGEDASSWSWEEESDWWLRVEKKRRVRNDVASVVLKKKVSEILGRRQQNIESCLNPGLRIWMKKMQSSSFFQVRSSTTMSRNTCQPEGFF